MSSLFWFIFGLSSAQAPFGWSYPFVLNMYFRQDRNLLLLLFLPNLSLDFGDIILVN